MYVKLVVQLLPHDRDLYQLTSGVEQMSLQQQQQLQQMQQQLQQQQQQPPASLQQLPNNQQQQHQRQLSGSSLPVSVNNNSLSSGKKTEIYIPQ